jgi:hypothetical protein
MARPGGQREDDAVVDEDEAAQQRRLEPERTTAAGRSRGQEFALGATMPEVITRLGREAL